MRARTVKRLQSLLTRLNLAYAEPQRQSIMLPFSRGDMRALIAAIETKLTADAIRSSPAWNGDQEEEIDL